MRGSLRERTFAYQLAAAAAVVVCLVGCGGAGSAAPTTTSGRHRSPAHPPKPKAPPQPAATPTSEPPDAFASFRAAMDQNIDYLDPGLAQTTEAWGVMWNVYLPLLGYRHANGAAGARIVPYLAESLPRISHNGRTYTLTLRKGLRYSNGKPVRASDFKRTIERDFLIDSPGVGFFSNIVGTRHFAHRQKGGIEGIRVDDATRTIRIVLHNPQADFENVLASEYAAPVPASAPPRDSSTQPLPSTGPYVIASYQPSRQIVEVRNPYFRADLFDGNVPSGNPDRVTWDVLPGDAVAFRRVLKGEDDWMGYYPVPSRALRWTRNHRGSQLRIFTPPNLLYFFMNTQVKPFTSVAVRRAVNYAISRSRLRKLAGGMALPTENILPPGYPSYRRHHLYPHNLRKARRLVRESGFRGARVVVWNSDAPGDGAFTKYLVDVLDSIGFRAHLRVVPASVYFTTIGATATHAQIGFADWLQDYPSPLDWFGVLLNGQRISSPRNDDYAFFDDPGVNARIAALRRRPHLTRSVDRAWAALDRRVMELAPWAPFLNRQQTDFFSARVDPRCYVNSVVYEFDYASACVTKQEGG
jgi:peptide/nickel transport system substrate-binding protein